MLYTAQGLIKSVGIVVQNNENKTLLAQRLNKSYKGLYGNPAGKVELQDYVSGSSEHAAMFEAAARELLEETGLSGELELLGIYTSGKYQVYTFLHYTASTLPEQKEPEKSSSWDWYSLDDLPPITEATRNDLHLYRTQKGYQ